MNIWQRHCTAGECFTFLVLLTLFLQGAVQAQDFSQIAINFESSETANCGSDVFVDIGESYGERSNGYSYGWLDEDTWQPLDATKNARDRGSESDDSCLFRTFVHMQYSDCCSDAPDEGILNDIVWQIQLPNGQYEIEVLCGEPTLVNSVHAIDANGVQVIPPTTPTQLLPEVSGSSIVSVTDGKLFLSAARGTNTKLSYVILKAIEVQEGCVPFPSKFEGQSISTLDCSSVKIEAPYENDFDGYDDGGLLDKNGVGTGFTMYLPSSDLHSAFNRNLLEVKDGSLFMTTFGGRLNKENNDHSNAVGVGLPLPDEDLNIVARFKIPEDIKNVWERVCLYFAVSDKSHITFCWTGTQRGGKVFIHYEQSDKKINRFYRRLDLDASREVTLRIELYPLLDQAKFFYQAGDGGELFFRDVTTGSEMFSKDAAGTDFNLGTRSFAGVFCTQAFRKKGFLTFELKSFAVNKIERDSTPVVSAEISFDTWYVQNVDKPTSMRYGPDGRLYVAHVDGKLSIISIDRATREETRQEFYPIGNRLLLGLEIDPDSEVDKVTLWLSHSDASQHNGEANSGVISKVSGPNFTDAEDVIIGLPRAVANHAPNQLRFRDDGMLFIAVGGNTGGGTPNDYDSDFGFRPEQCLSAALLFADVKAAGFNGDCTPKQDPGQMDATGIAAECAEDVDCDVQIYASGTRNPYDFYFYNDHIYMTDNGLGGLGTVPFLNENSNDCHGPVTGDDKTSRDPGKRDDLLYDVKKGDYYGHPNPARGECVFFGGNPTGTVDYSVIKSPVQDQTEYFTLDFGKYPRGTQPDPNFKLPIMSFGRSRSANGIIVYESDVFCGKLKGNILTTWYSQNDQVRRVVLNEEGTEPVSDETLPFTTTDTGADLQLKNPLCIEQDPLGNLYIGEFFGNRIRILDPVEGAC